MYFSGSEDASRSMPVCAVDTECETDTVAPFAALGDGTAMSLRRVSARNRSGSKALSKFFLAK